MASASTQIEVRILVYVGDPVDYQKFRHTALYFKIVNGSASDTGTTLLAHVTGVIGQFRLEVRGGYKPEESTTLVKDIPVGRLRSRRGVEIKHMPEIAKLMYSVPPDNVDPEFNCHSWISKALEKLVKEGFLTEEEADEGTTMMIRATLEAKDE